jgi:hypothetical protein
MAAKSSSQDYIPLPIMKSMSSVFPQLITHLANLSFSQGMFPDKFKHAATPFLKKPTFDTDLFISYQLSISNLNNISKILEKLFPAHLSPCILSSPNSKSAQSPVAISILQRHHFFTSSTSYTTPPTMDLIATLLPCLDLSAAFDKTDHALLLNRFQIRYGGTEQAFKWLRPYLTNKAFSVTIGLNSSSIIPVTREVPQTPLLGPILFSIYTSSVAATFCQFQLS